jgi:hypothetical protein
MSRPYGYSTATHPPIPISALTAWSNTIDENAAGNAISMIGATPAVGREYLAQIFLDSPDLSSRFTDDSWRLSSFTLREELGFDFRRLHGFRSQWTSDSLRLPSFTLRRNYSICWNNGIVRINRDPAITRPVQMKDKHAKCKLTSQPCLVWRSKEYNSKAATGSTKV